MPPAFRWMQITVPELQLDRTGELLAEDYTMTTAGTVNYRQEWRLMVESAADTTVTTVRETTSEATQAYANIANRYTPIGATNITLWRDLDTVYAFDTLAVNRWVMPVRDQTLTVEGTMNAAQWTALRTQLWTNSTANYVWSGADMAWGQTPLTDEQKAKIAKKAANDKRRREFAIIRARRLLADHLSSQEHDQLAEHGYFEITSSSGRKYRIYRGHSRNVVELDKQGREVNRLCAYPNLGTRMPDEDHMLAQKLLLENDEDAYRKVANHSRIYIPGQQAA